MAILVSDTSILIDLEKGGLLEAIFSLDLTFVVPDYLYEYELAEYNGAYLRHLGLGVLTLSSEENEVVQELLGSNTGLSMSDCSALVCALRDDHFLLTGDGLLRKVARAKKTEVCGIFWLLDQLEQSGTAFSVLFESLEMISNDAKCRLPKEEIKKRLQKWSS